jgi:hypothetical protein
LSGVRYGWGWNRSWGRRRLSSPGSLRGRPPRWFSLSSWRCRIRFRLTPFKPNISRIQGLAGRARVMATVPASWMQGIHVSIAWRVHALPGLIHSNRIFRVSKGLPVGEFRVTFAVTAPTKLVGAPTNVLSRWKVDRHMAGVRTGYKSAVGNMVRRWWLAIWNAGGEEALAAWMDGRGIKLRCCPEQQANHIDLWTRIFGYHARIARRRTAMGPRARLR